MRALHTADWHLSTQRSKLDPETGLNARLIDFYRCARFTVEDGLARGAQLVLHAGDAFNGCRPSPTEAWLFRQAVEPARQARVPVVLLLGNHDAPRSSVEKHALDLVRETPGLTVVDRPTLLNVWRGSDDVVVEPPEMSTPDGRELVLQLACLSWPNKQLLLASEENRKLDPGQLNELVQDRMMDCLHGLAGQLVPDVPALLLGHFSVDMAQAGGMNRLMALGGEFCLNLHDLTALPFACVCLGHIHKPQVLSESPWVGYCGSPECVTHGEAGEDKGYSLLDVGPDGDVVHKFIPTPYRRFVTVDLVSCEATPDNGLPSPEELADAIVRVRIGAAADVDMAALREQLEAAGVHEYQIATERAEAVRRRAVEVSAAMALEEALKAWLEQCPDLKPMMEELLAEAQAVEAAIAGGETA